MRCENASKQGASAATSGELVHSCSNPHQLSVALFRARRLVVLDPGAARSASLRACPWLPSAAPPALRETLNRSINLGHHPSPVWRGLTPRDGVELILYIL